jgi:hypothetical protein
MRECALRRAARPPRIRCCSSSSRAARPASRCSALTCCSRALATAASALSARFASSCGQERGRVSECLGAARNQTSRCVLDQLLLHMCIALVCSTAHCTNIGQEPAGNCRMARIFDRQQLKMTRLQCAHHTRTPLQLPAARNVPLLSTAASSNTCSMASSRASSATTSPSCRASASHLAVASASCLRATSSRSCFRSLFALHVEWTCRPAWWQSVVTGKCI